MIYLLYYDTDSGAREEWNTFYTPCEVFLDPAQRQARQAFLQQRYDGLIQFHTMDLEPQTNIQEPVEQFEYELEQEGDDLEDADPEDADPEDAVETQLGGLDALMPQIKNPRFL